MAKINIIAAIDNNRAIGYQNKLLFHIDEDMKHFKQLTTGHTIVMGRRTFESLPNGALPHRRNIVVSTTMKQRELVEGYSYHKQQGIEVFSSLTEALAACANEEDIYIIGGESIYRQTLPLADRLCLTEIADIPEGADAFFPEYDGWKETVREDHDTDEKHHYRYSFVDYEKKN